MAVMDMDDEDITMTISTTQFTWLPERIRLDKHRVVCYRWLGYAVWRNA